MQTGTDEERRAFGEMEEAFGRTEILLGREKMERLAQARVAVFGLGGVGGTVVEALARSGVGTLDLVDPDRLTLSNLNRQVFALHSTLGQYKAEAAADRVRDINPACTVHVHRVFFGPETADDFDFAVYDYVVDAIDTVTGKLNLIQCAKAASVPVISSMGAGNKLDPSSLAVADIYETSVCPLARVMRRELRKRGIRSLKVVYSTEKPRDPRGAPTPPGRRSPTPGSVVFVPAAAGLLIAGEVVRDLTDADTPRRKREDANGGGAG